MHHKKYSSAYKFIVSLCAATTLTSGLVVLAAVSSFWYSSPYTLFALDQAGALASVLAALSSGGALFLGGLASFIETNYGYQIL